MATTPATNVACMKYNGGGNAETICMIDLSTKAAKAARPSKKIKTHKGISSIHFMQLETLGVRVWHVANVGVGQLITWETIKKYHHGKNVCDPCVPLIHVPAAVDPSRTKETAINTNEFVPKIHRSHRNVKAKKRELELRRESKRRLREHNYEKQVVNFKTRVEEVKALQCQWCFKFLSSIEALQRHQQNGCAKAFGRAKKESSGVASGVESSKPNVESSEPNPSAKSDVPGPSVPTLTRGYAWKALRDHVTEDVGPRAASILESGFQRGTCKGGDRQSCFELVSVAVSYSSSPTYPNPNPHLQEEQLAGRLPVEERVSRYTIQTWLSSRLQKEKDDNNPQVCMYNPPIPSHSPHTYTY